MGRERCPWKSYANCDLIEGGEIENHHHDTNSNYKSPRGFYHVIFEKNWSSWFYNMLLRHLKINRYCMTQLYPVILVGVKNDMDFTVDTLIPRSDMLANRNSFS